MDTKISVTKGSNKEEISQKAATFLDGLKTHCCGQCNKKLPYHRTICSICYKHLCWSPCYSVHMEHVHNMKDYIKWCYICTKTSEDTKLFVCGRCKRQDLLYCSVKCQREDWPIHKKECVSVTMNK